ncbi:hypothetical protein OIO07_12025 [Bacillus paralicheniformis]|nr:MULTISPECIES: hypothetical protein [Bacillus subtilis group]MCV9368969.1 hypothetical protein [Bacillus paralicheniformis]MEB3127479.1 hypothetical protein [Bacillus paralicheniformis]WIG07433.1 hypothetical protein QN340_21450 [Bacillus paralicheniformis]
MNAQLNPSAKALAQFYNIVGNACVRIIQEQRRALEKGKTQKEAS